MKGSIKLFTVFGITVKIHVTFILLLLLVVSGGVKWLFIVTAIFFFVTLHELSHSLVAKRFGINVSEITLLPIGGVASMAKMPEKPSHEFLISIAGPALNLFVILFFYLPLKYLLGPDILMRYPFSTETWQSTIAYVYWLNLILAGFNMIPAFPMDGGRVLRSLLAQSMGYRRATKIAVNLGHIFALAFAYFGIVRINLILVGVAIFIYMAASNEELQVDMKEVLKKFRVRDILSRDFFTLKPEMRLADVVELIFRSHQEDFPIAGANGLAGFATRQDIITGIHKFGMEAKVGDVMRTDFPKVRDADLLVKVQHIMYENGLKALPVVNDAGIAGVVTLEDIGRVYAIISQNH